MSRAEVANQVIVAGWQGNEEYEGVLRDYCEVQPVAGRSCVIAEARGVFASHGERDV